MTVLCQLCKGARLRVSRTRGLIDCQGCEGNGIVNTVDKRQEQTQSYWIGLEPKLDRGLFPQAPRVEPRTACADTHEGVSRLDREAGPTYQTNSGSQFHIPSACQHCENPKCMDDCPPDALRRHPTGEIYIKDNCIGCGNCVANCPYDVIQLATVEPYKQTSLLMRLLFGERTTGGKEAHEEEVAHSEYAVKCDLCRNLPERRGGGTRAACVASCPTGAIVRVDPRRLIDEIQRND